MAISCQTKETPSNPGSLYYESWVFVGRDSAQNPFVLFVYHRKTQTDKKQVELESKVMMSKKNQTRLILQERNTQDGVMSTAPLLGPMRLQEFSCGSQKCLQTNFAKDFVMNLQSEPLPELRTHEWRESRIGDAFTKAKLSFEKEEIKGCLFVERGFSMYGPPAPFFGDFDWFALQDDTGECWLLSDGKRVGSFALSPSGKISTEVERVATETFFEAKSGQTIGSSWSLSVPGFSLTAKLSATSGHRGLGASLSPTKKVFYGHGSVKGELTQNNQSRGVVGWVQHISDE